MGGMLLWRHLRRQRPEDTALAGLKSFVQTQQQQIEKQYAAHDERIEAIWRGSRALEDQLSRQKQHVDGRLDALSAAIDTAAATKVRRDEEIGQLRNDISDLQRQIGRMSETLQATVDSFTEELAEFEATVKGGWSDLEGWREKDADPKLAALSDLAAVVPAIQQQVALLSENWGEAREAFAQVGGRLVALEDSASMTEAIIGRLPAPTPTTPMGPPPAGAAAVAGMEAQLADLLRRQGELQQNFLARQANRSTAPRPPAA